MIRRTDAQMRCLLVRHARRVLASSIFKPVARARGYRSITIKAELKRLGFAESQCLVPGLLIPIWNVFGEPATYQFRPDTPRIKNGKAVKYETLFGSKMVLDVHPFAQPQLGNPSVPLWITEGVRKGDAAVSRDLCCIALLGVWNFRGTNEHGGKTILPEWQAIALNGREVYLVYDSDVMLKWEVYAALAQLGAWLIARDAHVRYVYLPAGPGGVKTGLDDYLAEGHTVDDLFAFATNELRQAPYDATELDQPYVVTDAGIVWRKPTRDGPLDVPLANFSAIIVKDIIEDDGAEERRRYVLEAMVRGRTQIIDVPAHQFGGMSWVAAHLGASAVLEPGEGTKDRARHAMQTLSGEIPEHRVFAHTGWRQCNGIWVYLHGNGAIGPNGPMHDIDVGLRGPLSRIALPDPPEGQALIESLSTALQLLALLPPEIAYPLLGATWLAPLRELLGAEAPDFVLWSHGPSGSFKSELAALAQGFYGNFSRQSLPINFSATPNAVERFLFEAKDALLAVDDFHPAGDPREQQAMNQVANRLLRGAGNLAGRARMRADITLRPALDPRCLAIASGERLPEGHSSIARMMPMAVIPGAIDVAALTLAQENRHHYPLAMAGYLQWLAQRFDPLQTSLPERFRALRAELHRAGSHRREPGQLAHLLLGLESFFRFAVERGAMAIDGSAAHLHQARQVFWAQAREHATSQAEEAPAQLFVRLLADGFAGKRIYLEDKHGEPPMDAEQWGWERTSQRDSLAPPLEAWRHGPTASLVGALDDEWLLLYPGQVYQFVVSAARAAGRTFPIDQTSLIRRLDEAGLIATEIAGGERRRKVNIWIGSATKRVIKLRRDAVQVPSPDKKREDREGREESLYVRRADEDWPSRSSGNGTEPGKADSATEYDEMPSLPVLPGLPGFHQEDEPSESEEMAEWSM